MDWLRPVRDEVLSSRDSGAQYLASAARLSFLSPLTLLDRLFLSTVTAQEALAQLCLMASTLTVASLSNTHVESLPLSVV